MLFFSSIIVVAFSAWVFAMGIPNEMFVFGNTIAGFLCFIPLYFVLFKSKSYLTSAFFYSTFVTFTHLFSSFWLVNFQDFAIFTLGASSVAYFFLAVPFGIFFHYIFKSARLQIRPFLFALTITMWEYFKSSGFTAYPWGVIAMTTLKLSTFIQMADVTGVWGISYMMALIGAMESEFCLALCGFTNGLKKGASYNWQYKKRELCKRFTLVREKPNRPLLPSMFFVLFLISLINFYGVFSLNVEETPEKTISLLLVQQNADPWYDFFDSSIKVGQNLTRKGLKECEKEGKDVDLIIWSETSLSIAYEDYKDVYENTPNDDPFIPFLQEHKVPLLVGTQIRGKDDRHEVFNGVVLIDHYGDVLDSYAKMQLVPFAEFLPFMDSPIVQKLFDKLVGFSSGYHQGYRYKVLKIQNKKGKDISFATPVCYEDAFPALCAGLHEKGSDLLINLTNDSWSRTDSAEYQHFAIAYFRAIELRTTLVRSTNAGYTCAVDPKGNVMASLPLFQEGFLHIEIPLYSHKTTPYALFKDWLPLLLFILLIHYICKEQKVFVKSLAEYSHYNYHWQKTEASLQKENTLSFKKSIKLSYKQRLAIRVNTTFPYQKN